MNKVLLSKDGFIYFVNGYAMSDQLQKTPYKQADAIVKQADEAAKILKCKPEHLRTGYIKDSSNFQGMRAYYCSQKHSEHCDLEPSRLTLNEAITK